MAEKHTEKIKIWGIVQGVGFRPFVAKLADRMRMKGEVLNIGGLVDITLTDTQERIDAFLNALQREKPLPAEIVHMRRTPLEYRDFDAFTILTSEYGGDDEAAMIPADLAICDDCLAEVVDPKNPRYMHPFISCMVCGPRYTIMDTLPYDRDTTAMVDWPMCDFCEGEYTDRSERRYHAQTISCHDCGPVALVKAYADEPTGFEAPQKSSPAYVQSLLVWAKGVLDAGGVLQIKGLGGYNLVCDPQNEDAVARLRKIKNREQKPFAVMFRDIEQIREFCYTSETEERLLKSSAKPIILLEHRPLKSPELNRSRFIGSFLPSVGLQYLLLRETGYPLVFTSSNMSDMPIIKDDAEAFDFMNSKGGLVAATIYNERDIRVRVDDSVARVIDEQPQMIRRSKGYAPVPLYISAGSSDVENAERMIFATGGQLKVSFALSKGPFSYVSQYFGDLDSAENCAIYEENVGRMEDFFRIKPDTVVCDMHPLYNTTAFAEEYVAEAAAEGRRVRLLKVQHHHAHIASVMAEHRLAGPIIGVSMDGTGYGTDGAVWGGEFLLCRGAEFERKAHLKYVRMIGGDGSMKEAWKSALCYDYALSHGYADGRGADEVSVDLSKIKAYAEKYGTLAGADRRALVTAALDNGINTIKSSSMGRLFDGVAALLGIKDYNDYEGQCAIMLEDAAARAQKNPGANEADDLALDFHLNVCRMILEKCEDIRKETGVSAVALSGGTFQNKILMEESLALLRQAGFEVYYNVSVSPNDGGIALGQNYIAMHI